MHSTLCLASDLRRLKLADFAIAIAGALSVGLLLPRCGWEVWGESGLRASTLCAMGAASLLTLYAANLMRDRVSRLGMLFNSFDH